MTSGNLNFKRITFESLIHGGQTVKLKPVQVDPKVSESFLQPNNILPIELIGDFVMDIATA